MRGRRRGPGRLLAVLVSMVVMISVGMTQPASAETVSPPPPASASVSQRATLAVITWPEVAGATGYAIDYDTMPSFSTARRVTSGETVAVLTGLSPETTYYTRVAAWDAATGTAGTWGPVLTFTTTEPEYALPAPAMSAISLSSTSITAEWSAVGEDVSYEVAIGTSPQDRSQVKRVDETTAEFKDLAKETTYYVSARGLDATGEPVTAWSDPLEQKTPQSMPLRVGSYNILCENCSKGKATWAKRRGPLVSTIVDQDLDVLGVQEASIGRIPGGGPQYMDLIRRLGSPYKLTEYRRGVSPDVRIIYNSKRLKLVKQGIVSLPRGMSRRFLDWAIFEQRSTGKRFFFSNTHLEPKDGRKGWNARKRQAAAIVKATARLHAGLPVIAVGDYASTKWEKWGNAPYDLMQDAGYLDPLGNAYRSRNSAPGEFVEKRINTSYASLNMYKRKARNFAGDVNGSNTDYIFVTRMRVAEYEVVVRVDSAGRFVGVIPSDHNLLRATVHLP